MTYVAMLEDSSGDVVEIEHYCSPQCFTQGTGNPAYGNEWPCPERADYDQHCPTCGTLTVPAIEYEPVTWTPIDNPPHNALRAAVARGSAIVEVPAAHVVRPAGKESHYGQTTEADPFDVDADWSERA